MAAVLSSTVLSPLALNCMAPQQPSLPRDVSSAPRRRMRHVASENAFANTPSTPPRQKNRMVILNAEHKTPQAPYQSPVKTPKTSALRSFRRERLLKSASSIRIARLAEKPTATATIPRSRSVASLRNDLRDEFHRGPALLPSRCCQRARSAPILRVSPLTPSKQSNLNATLYLPTNAGSLGASLRASGPEMLHAIKMPPAALPGSVPAAKAYFDPTSGRTVHLRC